VRLKETQDPNAFGSQPTDLPFQQSTPLDMSSSKQDQKIQDFFREILMVRISEVHEPEDDSTERPEAGPACSKGIQLNTHYF